MKPAPHAASLQPLLEAGSLELLKVGVRNLSLTSAALSYLKHPARLTNLPKFATNQWCLQRFSDSGGRLEVSKSDFFHSYYL